MIRIQHPRAETTRLIVEPNRSMSWRANLWLALSLGCVCLGIALLLATQGLWLVLPFAGAETLAIIVCLWLTQRRLSRLEVITVDPDAICLEWGYDRPDTCVELPRRWSRLSYRCADNPFDNGVLSVSAHGHSYLLGQCLGRDEKRRLHRVLRSAIDTPGIHVAA